MPYLMKKGLLYDVNRSLDFLMDDQVIFIGEEHESPASHRAELILLKGLAKKDPTLVLALEMFERDVQEILNAYLKKERSEKVFLEQARPWPNYRRDYRPLIQFARERGMPVIAANIPRRAAAAVAMARQVSPDAMGEHRKYLPKRVHLRSKEYYQRFASSMEEMPHFSPMKRMMWRVFIRRRSSRMRSWRRRSNLFWIVVSSSAADISIAITTSAFLINSKRIIRSSRSPSSLWLHRWKKSR